MPDPSLFEEILLAPDRDHCPGAAPVVSYRPDDDPVYLAAIERNARARVELRRRGRWHGHLAELDEGVLGRRPEAPRLAVWSQRWHTARPIVWRGLVPPEQRDGAELGARRRLHDELKQEGGLRRFVNARRAELEPHFRVSGRTGRAHDPERDIERVGLTWVLDPEKAHSPRVKDLWLKSAWLSTHDADESLRMRLSFGREPDDDASPDLRRHLRVSELAAILLPEVELVHEHPDLAGVLADFVGGDVFFTQHIAYWNAPEGGALFHHDAFHEDVLGGQRGVCYVQWTGASAWLALSIEDLARRVIELAELLSAGDLPDMRRELFPAEQDFLELERVCGKLERVLGELARPGCGRLAPVVNRGPEFTALLADAGHACLLHPGDALILPNHGPLRTAMHAVFCAGQEPGYGISMAIRERHPPEIEAPPPPGAQWGPGKRPPQRHKKRRRLGREDRRRRGRRGER